MQKCENCISVSVHENDNLHVMNFFSFKACTAKFFFLDQIMLQMQTNALV